MGILYLSLYLKDFCELVIKPISRVHGFSRLRKNTLLLPHTDPRCLHIWILFSVSGCKLLNYLLWPHPHPLLLIPHLADECASAIPNNWNNGSPLRTLEREEMWVSLKYLRLGTWEGIPGGAKIVAASDVIYKRIYTYVHYIYYNIWG